MEKVPQFYNEYIGNAICQLSGVSVVQELQIWSISHGKFLASLKQESSYRPLGRAHQLAM
eukprot:scaffold9359_cov49-Cyclotella_meneghiniana.AAC.4